MRALWRRVVDKPRDLPIARRALQLPKWLRATSKPSCSSTKSAHAALEQALERLGLSARAYERVLKVSLTLADLDGVDQITRTHIAEAISYRNLDRASWGE